MNKDNMLSLIEDIADSSVPLDDYVVTIYKNGEFSVEIHHRTTSSNCKEILEMFGLSEIFNAYSVDWSIKFKDSMLKLVIN